MPNTYTQIYIQIVFAVNGRACLIPASKREELFKYITGIIRRRGQKLLAINGMSDHIHILVSLDASIPISDLVRDVKAGSSHFINEHKWFRGRFAWQEGFGAFSYSKGDIDKVIRYIQNQQEHHRVRNFKDEYTGLLHEFAVQYDKRYLFEWIDEQTLPKS